ncbi:MAG: DUF1996 domain-containing protein [Gaiellaceae bacterium]
MKRWALIGLVATLAALGAVSFAVGAPRQSQLVTLKQLAEVNFVSGCRFSHSAPDDPIVAPGKPGGSHDHSFVGNRSTNAWTTTDTLLANGTTCRRAGDTAAYWMPTLLVDGRSVAPLNATVYYRRHTLSEVKPFPLGFRMIAGDAKATSPQARQVTFWSCGALAGIPPSSEVPACPQDRRTSLRLHVRFPECWDGVHLDVADHKSHMAYDRRGRCPSSHPVALPALALIYHYPVFGPGTSLSSGGTYSGHADFFNAWRPDALASLVDGCLNALRHCGPGV